MWYWIAFFGGVAAGIMGLAVFCLLCVSRDFPRHGAHRHGKINRPW